MNRGKVYYYQVWVSSLQYRGHEGLTYHCNTELCPGNIVTVPLKQQNVLGIVFQTAQKPRFKTKPINFIYDLPKLPIQLLQLARWMLEFYPSPVGVITNLFLPASLGKYANLETLGNRLNSSHEIQLSLTDEQRAALSQIDKPDTYLLHGRTGSGKTQIYLELTEKTVSKGSSVIILSPEIGLTSQIATNFIRKYGESVVILHSRLTTKQRVTAWLKILRAQDPLVIIGPRSALFSPLHFIGLIVVDESHDQAYKQEQAPYYQSLRVASQLSGLHNATLVLGSATPSVTDYYLAQQRNKKILRLEKIARPISYQRQITIVDLKDKEQFSRSKHISLPLVKAVEASIGSGEQSLLYLNRRGTARIALCEICGWQVLCPHCDLPLTYHGDTFVMRCHTCAYIQPSIMNCISCGNPSLTFKSIGTKAIVEEVLKLFPEANVMRFDTDTSKSLRLENQYEAIARGDVDILVGTQLLTKGLDLPRLSTLGVILADSSLYLPDYTAQERTYQLLTQVLGRIGRGHVKSHAIIQTFHPDSPLLKAALDDAWQGFYNSELKERKKFNFPPFCHILKLSCHRATSHHAEKAAADFKQTIIHNYRKVIVEGPTPAYHEKTGGRFKWQLIVKSQDRTSLVDLIKLIPPNGWAYDLDPADLL